MTHASAQDWIGEVLSGDRRALARLITRVENRTPDSHAAEKTPRERAPNGKIDCDLAH